MAENKNNNEEKLPIVFTTVHGNGDFKFKKPIENVKYMKFKILEWHKHIPNGEMGERGEDGWGEGSPTRALQEVGLYVDGLYSQCYRHVDVTKQTNTKNK